MERNTQPGIGESQSPPVIIPESDHAALDFIRTETELSKYPIHNLAKKGKVDIRILKTTPTGQVELKWEVSFNDRYGQARQLAYKLDTIVINHRIDEAGRPLPRVLRIGSLNEICAELNLATHAGQNTKDLKRSFLQNASAFITAKFNYKGNDRIERHVEAGITRYGVIFTGEKLPDGRKADAVYVVFNDPFWEILNNAPVRPLDRAYMKELPPAAQRFYEIVSRKIFAALKNDYPSAKLAYSEYCTFSAQLRHFERQRVQDQMAKILRPHKEKGYIIRVKYEATVDTENKPDWIIHLTPGPKAITEFNAVHHGKKLPVVEVQKLEAGETAHQRKTGPRQQRLKLTPTPSEPVIDSQLVAEFTRRSVTENKAREILANLQPDQDVIAQLEYGDYQIQQARGKITNPAGFYVSLVAGNVVPPPTFETSAKRKAREEEQRQRAIEQQVRQELEQEYDWYCTEAVDRYMLTLPIAEVEAVHKAEWQKMRAQYAKMSPAMIDGLAAQTTKREFRNRAPLMTIEEFAARRKQGSAGPRFIFEVSSPVPAAAPAGEIRPAGPVAEFAAAAFLLSARDEAPAATDASAPLAAEHPPENTKPDQTSKTEHP